MHDAFRVAQFKFCQEVADAELCGSSTVMENARLSYLPPHELYFIGLLGAITAIMRDDFSTGTKELLAKRVGFVCSNPECQQPTSGPQVDPSGVVNIGVAAHISAASPGGSRYEADLSPEQRADSSNGVWLCQTCAKLIDNDPVRFTRPVLEGWKRAAERAAATALAKGRDSSDASQSRFAKLERLMPSLLEEMREDLRNHPTSREFVVLKRDWVYNGRGFYLAYYLDEHEDLEGKLQVLANFGLVREITYNNVRRYLFTEELVDYLV